VAARRTIYRLTLRGLPELERFPSQEARDAALRRFAEATRPRDLVVGIAVCALAAVGLLLLVRYAVAALPLGPLARFRGDLAILIVVAAVLVVIRWMHRRSAAASLRGSLLECGVPTCRACGHSLEGLRIDAERCPECGRELDATERAAVNAEASRPRPR
jgi:hypothetical protein